VSRGALIAAVTVFLLAVHNDFWWWKDATLVFGFLPIGLASHVVYALMASAGLWLLVRYAWPHELEEEDPPEHRS